MREELLATALVRVEDGVLYGGNPYLGFHPTLPYAAEPDAVADKAEAGKRFVGVYYGLAASVDKALRGAEPAGAMRVMLREEGNLRRAMALAFERADHEVGARLADTIGSYLRGGQGPRPGAPGGLGAGAYGRGQRAGEVGRRSGNMPGGSSSRERDRRRWICWCASSGRSRRRGARPGRGRCAGSTSGASCSTRASRSTRSSR